MRSRGTRNAPDILLDYKPTDNCSDSSGTFEEGRQATKNVTPKAAQNHNNKSIAAKEPSRKF